ncbi:MAG: ABC transporter ATP-binding protein [Oscillospiraceae bacterium]|nr:ABC transporter ATP-binding protein [Oscillospiraceae bacterium]
MAVFEVKDLSIIFHDEKEPMTVVDNLSFTVNKGEIMGLVGESGSGKTMTALAAAGLLGDRKAEIKGQIIIDGKDILSVSAEEMRKIRGSQVGMIFQEPMTSLDPAKTVGWQVEEALMLHTELSKEDRRAKALKAIKEAGLTDCERIYNSYPHQLSGGQRQRVMIAAALITKPKLLLADEPTTALDVTVQKQILDLLKEQCMAHGIAVLFISHDLSLVRSMCERMIVMQNGRAIEEGTSENIFTSPKMPYTKELIEAVPKFERECDSEKSAGNETVLTISGLSAFYPQTGGKIFSRKRKVQTLFDISLDVKKGEIIGLAGESGSGKSTLARCILDLHRYKTGEIRHNTKYPQMVFQDAGSSLNPSKTVEWILEEPLKNCTSLNAERRRECVTEMLYLVKLPDELRKRRPGQLSGGQRQRVSIAAALMLKPGFLIADEPVSALDVTVQKQILSLMKEIARETGVSVLLISHDLRVVYQMCDRVLIMKNGRIVEEGNPLELYKNPKHPYTKELLDSAGA